MKWHTTMSLVFCWSARGLGGAILAFVLLSLFSGGQPKMGALSSGELILGGCFALSMLGNVLLWKWQFAGGLVAILGIGLFYLVEFALAGQIPTGWVLPLFFLPGFLSICNSYYQRGHWSSFAR